MANIRAREAGQSTLAESGEATPGKLAVNQQTALELLVMGKSISETARSAGVSRTTIYQWLRHDPTFQAAYNQWHDQLEEGCRSRLLILTDKAIDAIEKALEKGDARAALQLLKGMGMIRQRAIGPTDPVEVQKEAEMERERRNVRRKRDEARLGLDRMTADMGA